MSLFDFPDDDLDNVTGVPASRSGLDLVVVSSDLPGVASDTTPSVELKLDAPLEFGSNLESDTVLHDLDSIPPVLNTDEVLFSDEFCSMDDCDDCLAGNNELWDGFSELSSISTVELEFFSA